MNKPQSLRNHLLAAIADLQRDTERLLVFIEGGSVVSTLAPGASFEYRYTLKLVVTDFGGHPDSLMVPLLDWIRVEQSELLTNTSLREQIRFEAEVLANDKVDVEITLPLTERVGVHRHNNGEVHVEHFAEPVIEAPFPAQHWHLLIRGEVVAEWDAPGG